MQGFDGILGQESIVGHFREAIRSGKLSHAYIFTGEEGFGKRLLAERVAAAIECESEGERPCGMCMHCLQASVGTHPDIIHVVPTKTRIGVDDIREQLINDIQVKPYEGNYKVYIIADADTMNEAAQNALLKTLEEPPAYAVILLLAVNTGSFLQTILSRSLTLSLKPVKTEVITEYLMNNCSLPDYMAKLCASFACGSIGKAIKYASDPDFSRVKDAVLSLVRDIDKMSHNDVMKSLTLFGEEKKRDPSPGVINDFFDLLSLWYRDVLYFKATRDRSKLLFSDEFTEINRQATLRSYENLNEIPTAIENARKRLNANVYFDITMEMLLMSLRGQ